MTSISPHIAESENSCRLNPLTGLNPVHFDAAAATFALVESNPAQAAESFIASDEQTPYRSMTVTFHQRQVRPLNSGQALEGVG
jgi:hypothetical protein